MPDQDHGVTVPTNRKTAPDRPLTGCQPGLPREQGYENKAHHVCTGHGGLLTNTIGWQSEKRETARARVGDSPEAQGTKRSKKSFLCPCRSTRMASQVYDGRRGEDRKTGETSPATGPKPKEGPLMQAL